MRRAVMLGWVGVVLLASGCGFGVGAFRSRERSGLFRADDQSNVRRGYVRVERESWTDVGSEFGTSIGFKPEFVVARALQGGALLPGYGFNAHAEVRWKMLELTGGYAQQQFVSADGSGFVRNGGVVGLNYYFPMDEEGFLHFFAGGAFQFGSVLITGARASELEDIAGGRVTGGAVVVFPELIFEQDLMLRAELGLDVTGPFALAGVQTVYGAGFVSAEALLFF